MATRVKPTAKDLHEGDFFVWSNQQAARLRERRFDELDLTNLIEEIEDLGGGLRRSVRVHAMFILEHLLKLQHWPQSEHRLAWRETVRRERSELLNDLTPSLRYHLADNCLTSMRAPGTTPRARCAIMASKAQPTRSPRPAPTRSIRSLATGCREGVSSFAEHPGFRS
jgi:hypothetical protein